MFELVLRAAADAVEPVSDVLIEQLNALSVSVEDADAGTAGESALFGEPGLAPAAAAWRRSTLIALFAGEAQADAAAAWLLAQAAGVEVQALRPLDDRDWVRLTQAQFAPVQITGGFWIVPSWHEPPAQARHVMRLDPGLAFGTGTHPTTRMCLRWIAAQAGTLAAPDMRVLDYGCGSGILAIGAALHGARTIDAVDIDPAAVEAARANARANGVTVACGLPDIAGAGYGIVLANILATPLTLLAPLLSGKLASGGQLVLAGILERQAVEIAAAYSPWVLLDIGDAEDGWVLMTGRKAPDGAAR